MNEYFEVIGISSPDDKHLPEVEMREGIRVKGIQIARTFSPVRDIIAFWKLFRFLKKEKPVIVHTHTPKAGLLGMMAARCSGVPIRLHTLAGLPLIETRGYRKTLYKLAEQLTGSCANRIYPNSSGLAEIVLHESIFRKEKLKIIANGSSNGVDTKYFSVENFENPSEVRTLLREKLKIGLTDLVYCFVGRIVNDKGINELLDAFEIIVRRQNLEKTSQKVKLLLVGSLDKDRDNLAQKKQHKIQNHPDIVFTGRHDDIRPYLLISDIFVLPSYREGFPNSVLQAASMNLPCIVSDINGCNEIIKHKYNGLLIPHKSVNALTEAMITLFNDTQLRQMLADNSRKVVLEKFRNEILWDALLDEYKQLLQTNHINLPVV